MIEPGVWEEFERDPRRPEFVHLRSADTDREIVHRVLAEAFAEGRLDRQEFDDRADAVSASKTLGELPGFVVDLIPVTPLTASPIRKADLDRGALARYQRERRQAVWGLVWVSMACWFIWMVTSGIFNETIPGGEWDPSFPWPIFPTVALLMHVGSTIARKQDIMDQERRRLERRALREMGRHRRGDSPGWS